MKKTATQIYRGLMAVFLSLALLVTSLTAVVASWRGVIDNALGTTSTKTIGDDKFVSDYKSTDELVEAHKKLGEEMSAEGTVLLKNENGALPLSSDHLKVTLLGMGSAYPFMGGVMGSQVNEATAVNLTSALKEKGFTVNPTVLSIYENFGSVVTGEKEFFGNKSPIYGFRPAGFGGAQDGGLYKSSEPALSAYTEPTDSQGGGADDSWQDSFKEYNDAAIVVISRPGSEGSDFYAKDKGIDSAVYGTDSALSLVENEKALIELAKKNFDKVIVMINSGSAMEIGDLKADTGVDAILNVGFPGAYGFLGVADVLKGEVSPSGHLTDTFVADSTSAPAAANVGKIKLADLSAITAPDSLMGQLSAESPLGSFGGEPRLAADYYLVQAEGIYTGYKYYETRYYDLMAGAGHADGKAGSTTGNSWNYDDEVVYPFGYGLSYTTFEQTLDEVKADPSAGTVTAKVTVKNTGDVAGKSVAQLYVSAPYTDYDKANGVEKPAVSLLGYEKSKELAPGESETLTVTAAMKYMASWDSKAKEGKGGWILDGGNYVFASASDAHDAANQVLAANGAASVEGTAQAVSVKIGAEGKVDAETFAKAANNTEIVNQFADADVNYYAPGYATYLSRSDWEGTYPKTYDDLAIGGDKKDEWVKNLTNEVYQMKTDEPVENMKGQNEGLKLADLAGEDNILDPRWDKLVNEIPVDILIPRIVKGGQVSDVIEQIASPLVYQNDGPNGFSGTLDGRGLNKDDANASYTMNTMANEVVIAQTYNKTLANDFGKLMGNDGLMSGNWLIWGSAANLHRTAFNGRNFEYYSEDPMVSNYMSTETVKGALAYGVIIGPKHFAFNDQESQRSGIAVYMNEQKIREGELRAFQGSVEEGAALGIMSSFSRVGATPCNGSVALLKNVLRDEWGFKGLISTDMMNNAGYFRPEMCVYAGVTMIADFSSNETMEQVNETWPYFTIDRIGKDQTLVNAAREDMKYQLYAFAHSAAQNVKTEKVTPWWEAAVNAVMYSGYALAVLFAVLYVISAFKAGKGKEAKEA